MAEKGSRFRGRHPDTGCGAGTMVLSIASKTQHETVELEDGKAVYIQAPLSAVSIASVKNNNGIPELYIIGGEFELWRDGTEENDLWIVPKKSRDVRDVRDPVPEDRRGRGDEDIA